MDYKSNAVYKASKAVCILSLIVSAVCFILMGMGIDGSVFPFFAAAVVGTVLYLIGRSVRLRYERAEKDCTEVEPPFYSVYVFFYDLFDKIKNTKKSVVALRVSYTAVSVLLIVSLFLLWQNYFIKTGRPKDPEYNANLADYPIVEAELLEAVESGDTATAERDRRILANYDNKINYIETTTARAAANVPIFAFSSGLLGAVDVGLIFAAAVVKKKRGKAA